MIIQITNMAAGFILAIPKLELLFGKDEIDRFERILAPYLREIGIVEFAIGAFALLVRLHLSPFVVRDLGASFPQAIPALLIGIVLASEFFDKYPAVKRISDRFDNYRLEVGILGIAVGLGSLLFGCPYPLVCGQLWH